MAAIDTNVVVRLLTADDPEQTRNAEALLARGPLWVSTIVLVETVWVLSAVYGWRKPQLLVMLQRLADSRDFILQDVTIVKAAIATYEHSSADLADCLALELARSHRQLPFATFDTKASRLPGAEHVGS
jgi:predicted nucleic-acid-binding protein